MKFYVKNERDYKAVDQIMNRGYMWRKYGNKTKFSRGRTRRPVPVDMKYDFVLTSYGDVRPDILFQAMVANQKLNHISFTSRNFERFEVQDAFLHFFDNVPELEVFASARYSDAQHFAAEVDGVLVMVRINDTKISVDAASDEPTKAWVRSEYILDQLPFETLKKSQTRVPVYFWGEGSAMNRSIPIVKWDEEMYINYSKDIIDQVHAAVENDLSDGIIVWHGPPGTGKTSALRALISNRPEGSVHYITDPEVLVNRADYIYSILEYASRSDEDEEVLVVCEDSGPLVTEQTGMGLGRILNLADGILGQGFNLRLLFTTNDPVTNFHPAVLRPGRCAQELEFGQLSREEVNRWCDFHDRSRVNEPQTLAWLYANVKEDKMTEIGQYL